MHAKNYDRDCYYIIILRIVLTLEYTISYSFHWIFS